MDRRLIAWLGTLLCAGAMAGAQSTQPSVYVDAPPAAQTPPAEGQSVLVCPVSTPSGNYWFASAFQRDVATDLSQMSRLRVLAPDSTAPAGNDDALHRAREAGAAYVLVGQARPYGNSMQVTGQVLEVSSGRSIASLNSTAPEDNLFPLEDTIALQAAQALPGSLVTRSAAAATQPAGGDVNGPPYISELNPGGPPASGQPGYASAGDAAGAVPYDYPSYSYYYYYPGAYYDPYYYPYWGYGWGASIVFVPGYGWCHYYPGWYHGYGYYHSPYWGYRGYYYGPHYYYGPRYYGHYGHYGPYYHGPAAHGYGGAHPGGGGGGAHGGGGHGGGGRP